MKALVRDRILGLDSSGSQLGTYSPGNMLDDSTRNVWISSQYKDSITMECNTQVNSFFIGNVRSDDIRYTFFKKALTATSGQIEHEGPQGGGNYVHFLLELDGNRTGNNRPFSNGDNLRIRIASNPASHVESASVELMFEDYDSVADTTKIFCRYQYGNPYSYTTQQSIKNHIHNVNVTKGVTLNNVIYTTFNFPTQQDKARFLVATNSNSVTEQYVHTIYWDGSTGNVTPQALADIPATVYGTNMNFSYSTNVSTLSLNSNTGLENDTSYTASDYGTNRWELQEVTNALLAGTLNYSPYSPSAHYIRFTNNSGFNGVYGRFRSHDTEDFNDSWSGSAWGWQLDSQGFNWTDYQMNASDTGSGNVTNLASWNTTSQNRLFHISGDTIVSGELYSFQLGRSEMALTLTSGVLGDGDTMSVSWLKSGEYSAGTGSYVVKDSPSSFMTSEQLAVEPNTIWTTYSTGDEAVTTSILVPSGITLEKTATRIPVSGDQVVLSNPPVVDFYQQDTTNNDIKDVKTATRFYRSLGDFVQGIFVDALSVFVDLPYDDEPSKIEVSLKNENDRRLNKAMYWLKDSNEGTVVSSDVTTSLSGVDGKVTLSEAADHNLSVGDVFYMSKVNHSDSTVLNTWSGTTMPLWYNSYDFNGEHIVTEIVDGTEYKSEQLISSFTTQSEAWNQELQRFRNSNDDGWISITSSRGGYTRGRFTESPVTVSSITYGNGIAQVSYSSPHGLVDGDTIIISGSTPALFNNTFQVAYVSSYTVAINYSITDLGSAGDATGTINSFKPIDLTDFGVIKVGSHLLYDNIDTTIESTQIVSIRGTGTSTGDVKVKGELPSGNLSKIFTPVFGGIVKAGYSLNFPNSQVGLTHSTKDFSIKKELNTGAYHFLNRITAKDFSGQFLGTSDQADKFLEFAKQQMGSPFAVNVLSDMNLNVSTSFYAYFATPPSITYNNRMDNIRDVSFQLKEVL